MRNLSHTLIRFFVYNLLLVTLGSCMPTPTYDVVFYDMKTPSSEGDGPRQWIGIKDGIIASLGTLYTDDKPPSANEVIDLSGTFLYPGLIDAHGHLFGYAEMLNMVNLFGAESKEECIERIARFIQKNPSSHWIIGRGWDQNDWPSKEFPSVEDLNQFEGVKIYLTRVDGHAAWVNHEVMEAFDIPIELKMVGGSVLNGILIDNAESLVDLPERSATFWRKSLLRAQDSLVKYGITAMTDAGLSTKNILILDSLQEEGKFSLFVNAMIAHTESDLQYFEEHGPIVKNLLRVQSVKAYLDGALGSRGALLRAPYHDLPEHYGLPLLAPEELDNLRDRCLKNNWQLCVHAIGDSAHRILLKSFYTLDTTSDLRFRVEHAQIMTPEDSVYYSHPNIVASIQPTHATSDMYWAETRLGSHRLKHAYSFKRILNASGLVALGTDFPIEHIDPLHTFFAAVDRTDNNNWPENGFLAHQKLTAEQTLRGMTYGAAYSAFGESDYGSIKIGQKANFTVLNQNLFNSQKRDRKTCKVEHTIVSGNIVYSR